MHIRVCVCIPQKHDAKGHHIHWLNIISSVIFTVIYKEVFSGEIFHVKQYYKWYVMEYGFWFIHHDI